MYIVQCTYLERLFDIAVSGLGVLGKEFLQIVPWNFPGSLKRPVFPRILWPLGGKVLVANLSYFAISESWKMGVCDQEKYIDLKPPWTPPSQRLAPPSEHRHGLHSL